MLTILDQIRLTCLEQQERDALLLALVHLASRVGSNLKFGPEPFVARKRRHADLFAAFVSKVSTMAADLAAAQDIVTPSCQVDLADSREIPSDLNGLPGPIGAVITSPPYPTEKDYTRHTRIELALLGYVNDRQTLRGLKRRLLRSNSKGLYIDDSDERFVQHNRRIMRLVNQLRRKALTKSNGFAQLYPRVILEYFGGMHRHLNGLFTIMAPGARVAYVFGDQRTFLQTHTATGAIVAEIAHEIGYVIDGLEVVKARRASTGSRKPIPESVLLMRKPTS